MSPVVHVSSVEIFRRGHRRGEFIAELKVGSEGAIFHQGFVFQLFHPDSSVLVLIKEGLVDLVILVVLSSLEADDLVTDLVDAWAEGALLVDLRIVHLLQLLLFLALLLNQPEEFHLTRAIREVAFFLYEFETFFAELWLKGQVRVVLGLHIFLGFMDFFQLAFVDLYSLHMNFVAVIYQVLVRVNRLSRAIGLLRLLVLPFFL